MNIFFCAHDIVEYDGTSYYSNPISTQIKRYANENDLIACYAPIIDNPKPSSRKIENSNVRFVNAPKIDSLKHVFNINRYYDELHYELKNNDLAIIHVHVSLINSLCVYAAKRTNTPFLTVIVGCAWDALWNHSIKGKLMAPLCYYLEKWCMRKSEYSIYVTKSFLQKRYPTEGKWIACSNVDLNFKEEPTLRNLKDKSDTIHLATIAATNVIYKGQQYVIKSLALLKKSERKYVYHLVGAGDTSYLKKIAKDLNVSDMVVFHGPLNHDDIFTFLDTIDIYIQPSKQEGLPRSVIEAMSKGCMCMGSDIGGIPELIESKYLFKPGDYKQIAHLLSSSSPSDILNQGILNIEKSKRYSTNNLDLIREEFINKFRNQL